MINGEFNSSHLEDYCCTAVSITSASGPCALQVGGDVIGQRTAIRIGMKQIDIVRGSRAQCAPKVGFPSQLLAAAR